MSRSGKTLTIFLVVFFLLLISLTVIVTFFFVKERETRQATEQKLAASEETRVKLEEKYKASMDEIGVLNNKINEQNGRITDLVAEIDLGKGVNDELKKANMALQANFETATKERKQFEAEIIAVRESNSLLKNELVSVQDLRDQIVSQLQQAEARIKALEQKLASVGVIDLEKIVVTPGDVPAQNAHNDGQILKVNAENNFVIIDLGSGNGVDENTVVQFFRQDALLGEGKVTRAQAIMSAVDILPPLAADQLQVKDRAVIKK